MRIYLAGPMSGFPDFNFPAFHKAAAELRAEGHEIFNPAEEDLKTWGDLETIRKEANYRVCLKKDLNKILDWAEGVALLPGWEKSPGALIEKALAEVLKLEIRYIGVLKYYSVQYADGTVISGFKSFDEARKACDN